MAHKKAMSKTMRIDLIPNAPQGQVAAQKERVVVTTSGRTKRAVVAGNFSSASESFQALFQSIYDAALICGLDGRIQDVNPRAVEFLFYGHDNLCEMSILDVISGADASLVRTLLENLENERYTLIQAYCVRKNGTVFPSEIAVNRLEADETKLCFFVRDITLRRQAEEMLRTEHNAIQNANDGIAVADTEAQLEYVNPSVARMWGYASTEDLIGTDVRDLLRDTDAGSEMIGSVMGNHENWRGEMKAARADGSEFDVRISAVCNLDSDGELTGIVFSFVDVSDRKRAEEAEKESERQRVMLESLGAACHHLGQPATILLANLGVMEKKMKDPDPQIRHLVGTSLSAIKNLGDILHRLNAVNQYKTTHYLNGSKGGADEQRIIEI